MSTQPSHIIEAAMNSFFDAVEKEEYDRAKSLLAEQAQSPELSIKQNINYRKPENGTTALHLAAMAEQDNLAILLLANDADPTITDNDGHTPVHDAAENGKLNNLKVLLEKDKNLIYAADQRNNLALHLASTNGHSDVVAYLSEIMDTINQQNKTQATALIEAASNGNPECVRLLIPKSNIFCVDKYNKSALHAASSEKDDYKQKRKLCIEYILDAYAGLYGDISTEGIQYVDFSNKIMIGIKMSDALLIDCLENYTHKNETLQNAILTPQHLDNAIKNGKIKKEELPKILNACNQKITMIKNLPDFSTNDEHAEIIKQITELQGFIQQLMNKPTSLAESLKHLFLGGPDKTDATPPPAPTAETTSDAHIKPSPPK